LLLNRPADRESAVQSFLTTYSVTVSGTANGVVHNAKVIVLVQQVEK